MMTELSSWKTLRQTAPLLSYSLLFQTPKQRAALADLLLFGLELDFIVSQASEPMLALIRLKWWEEQLGDSCADQTPLLSRLNRHIQTSRLQKTDLLGLLSNWQETVSFEVNPQKQAQNCWAELLKICAVICALPATPDSARIGAGLYQSRKGLQVETLPSAREIHAHLGKGSEFLIILAYLARRGGQANPEELTKDTLILFKILWQVMVKPSV